MRIKEMEQEVVNRSPRREKGGIGKDGSRGKLMLTAKYSEYAEGARGRGVFRGLEAGVPHCHCDSLSRNLLTRSSTAAFLVL